MVRRWRAARSVYCLRGFKARTTCGWKTFETGASADNCGGATAFLSGTSLNRVWCFCPYLNRVWCSCPELFYKMDGNARAHPAVYILILPECGVISHVVSTFSTGKKKGEKISISRCSGGVPMVGPPNRCLIRPSRTCIGLALHQTVPMVGPLGPRPVRPDCTFVIEFAFALPCQGLRCIRRYLLWVHRISVPYAQPVLYLGSGIFTSTLLRVCGASVKNCGGAKGSLSGTSDTYLHGPVPSESLRFLSFLLRICGASDSTCGGATELLSGTPVPYFHRVCAFCPPLHRVCGVSADNCGGGPQIPVGYV